MAENTSPPKDANQLAKYIVDSAIEKDRTREEMNTPKIAIDKYTVE